MFRIALFLSIAVGTASAQPLEQPPCAAIDNGQLPAELKPMADGGAIIVAARDRISAPPVAVGVARSATLLPQSEVTFVFPSATHPVASPSAGTLALRIERAGDYEVAIGNGAWVDVVHGLKSLDPVGHGHGPRCSAAHKVLVFALGAGDYLLELSNSADARVTVLVARKP